MSKYRQTGLQEMEEESKKIEVENRSCSKCRYDENSLICGNCTTDNNLFEATNES